ncbi:MAG: 7-carboxy-7-deazaguanine synthase QueE [Candidatus Eutrophobiaceae bacterium]
MNGLRINEIFHSIQGESLRTGLPTVFVRLAGCPLRCVWCDTEYAFHHGKTMSMEAILNAVAKFKCTQVTVTGGEPLAQKGCLGLLTELCEQKHRVSLETSGAFSLHGIDHRVMKVVDVKPPGSGEMNKNREDLFDYLLPHDQLKFVLTNHADYEWAREKVRNEDLHRICEILFSPVWNVLQPNKLAEWILRDRLPVRLQLQIHKILWGEMSGV